MNSLKNFVCLSEKIAVYVPSTNGTNTPDKKLAEKITNETAAAMSEMFGGATITRGVGAWMSPVEGLVREQVNIVYSFTTPEKMKEYTPKIIKIIEHIKEEMKQEAVSAEIENKLYLI